jgi:hypothetical protein
MSVRLVGIDYVACPHVMQVLSGTLKTCARALGTYVSICTDMTDKLFFMLEARDPQGDVRHVALLKATSTGR